MPVSWQMVETGTFSIRWRRTCFTFSSALYFLRSFFKRLAPNNSSAENAFLFIHLRQNNAGCAESVAAYRGFNSRTGSTAADHVPDIRARHGFDRKSAGLADRGAEQRPLSIIRDTGHLEVGVEIVF